MEDGVKEEPKQVLVMRTDLKMRKGKMVSQGAHAAMKIFFDAMIPDREKVAEFWANTTDPENQSLDLKLTLRGSQADWVLGIFTKICLRVESEEELEEIYKKAQDAGLPCTLIEDVGKTEFKGVRTKTCCAIGPAMPSEIDPITGHLKPL